MAKNRVSTVVAGETVSDIIADVASDQTKTKTKTVKTKTPTAQNAGRAKTKTNAVPTVDGFALTFASGVASAELFATLRTRATTNPWYIIAEWLGKQPTGYITITRTEGSKEKSPMSRLDAAITRARKLKIEGFSKLDARSGAVKGTWYFIHRA